MRVKKETHWIFDTKLKVHTWALQFATHQILEHAKADCYPKTTAHWCAHKRKSCDPIGKNNEVIFLVEEAGARCGSNMFFVEKDS